MHRTGTRTLLTVLVVTFGLAAVGIGVAAGATGTTGDPGAIVTTGDPGSTGTAISAGGAAPASPAVAAVAQVNRTADDRLLAGMAGSGTADDPYVITNASELQAMRADASAHYVLGSDVDAGETATWGDGQGFVPIGDGDEPFRGTFDGRGHEITGLTIGPGTSDVGGLFGVLGREAVVRDVTLASVDASDDQRAGGGGGGSVDGAVAGENHGRIANVSVTGTVVTRTSGVGALVGENQGIVTNASADATVTGAGTVGGLVGRNSGTIRRSTATGTVTGTRSQVGGLVGSNGGTIERSTASGAVEGESDVGGLVGSHSGDGTTDDATVRESVAAADVRGTRRVGGLAGETSESTIVDSYAVGAVNGSGRVGGLVGVHDGVARRSYAAGTVAGATEVGGLTQVDWRASGYAVDAYWVRGATGQSISPDGTGLSVAAATGPGAADAFEGFDFGGTWRTTDGYPVLAWQDAPPAGVAAGLQPAAVDPSIVDPGATVALNATESVPGAGSIAAVEWRLDGETHTGARATVAAPDPGWHTAHLTVTTDDGRTASLERPVLVDGANTPPRVDLVAEPRTLTDHPADSPETVRLDASGSNDPDGYIDRYEWDYGDGSGGPSSSPVEVKNYDEPGTYTVEVTAVDNRGLSATTSVNVTYDPQWPPQPPGNGTADDPYRISTIEEFRGIEHDLDAHYVLVDDVDANATSDWNSGSGTGLNSVGNKENELQGTLDGRGHEIEGLYLDNSSGGLLGAVGEDGRVEDLRVRVARASVGGALADRNEGTIANVTVSGAFTADGGLVAENAGLIRNARADVRLRGRGGIAARNGESGTIRGAEVAGVIDDERFDEWAGGVVATNRGTIVDSRSTATVRGRGIAGGLAGTSRGTISDSRASGDVEGDESVGGLVGVLSQGFDDVGVVRRSAATGDVDGDREVGGLVGDANGRTTVADAYATGDVTARHEAGGLVGEVSENATVERGYAAGVVRGATNVGGLVGRIGGDLRARSPGHTHWRVAATEDLDALAAREDWRATDRYPALAWEDDRGTTVDAHPVVDVARAATGEPIALNASDSYAAAGIASYRWTIAGETVDGEHVEREYAGERATHAFAEPGEYEITLTVTDERGRTDAVGASTVVGHGADDLAGNGTAAEPYRIGTVWELLAIDDAPDAHFALSGDVDASATWTWNGGAGVTSLAATPPGAAPGASFDRPSDAREAAGFTGTLDGRGHAIENATLAAPLLFAVGDDGTAAGRVRALRLENANAATGAPLAYVNEGRIANASASGTARGAGLVRLNAGTIVGAAATVDVESGGRDVGGLVGRNEGVVNRSRADGDVSGLTNVGGLVGANADGLVVASRARGDVSGHEAVGGLAGSNDGTAGVRRAYATGDTSGENAVGGLIGTNGGPVREAFAAGRVENDEEEPDPTTGGLVGANRSDGAPAVAAAYWDVNASNQSASAGGVGLTTDRMTGPDAPEHMDGFDFEHAWATTDGYPILTAVDEALGEGDAPPPVVDDRPRDPDDDGLYEDVNGNGRQDIADAVDLFRNRNDVDPALFDFNDSGGMSIGDAVALFRENVW